MKTLLLTSLICLLFFKVTAQTIIPFDSLYWNITAKLSKENFKGKDCIRLVEGDIFLKDSSFQNGTIEFDMTLTKTPYFPGISFRIQNPDNFESVYLRPHQMGNPDALQYTPVFNGQAAWQLYHGEGYSTAVMYPFEEWIHIKLIVKGNQAEVYVGEPNKPALVIHQLKGDVKPGKISIGNGSKEITRFANFSYKKDDNPLLQGKFQPETLPQPATILNWQVSSTFDEKLLQNDYTIPQPLLRELKWSAIKAENSGTLNISKLSKLAEGSNTVFAKVIIMSDKVQVKKLNLGFSDRSRVYCNGRLLYTGQDEFRSRDYRFLGTIGYFDQVYVELKKGQNEIWIAISETFGGWGLKMQVENMDGLKVL